MLEQEDDTSGDVTLDPEFAVPHQHVRRNKNNKVHRQSSRASASQSGRCLGNDMPVSSAVQLNDSFDRSEYAWVHCTCCVLHLFNSTIISIVCYQQTHVCLI